MKLKKKKKIGLRQNQVVMELRIGVDGYNEWSEERRDDYGRLNWSYTEGPREKKTTYLSFKNNFGHLTVNGIGTEIKVIRWVGG